jgi:predicted ester cyclase
MEAFFARRQEALSRLDATMLASLHAENGVLESPLAGGMAVGREAIEQVYRTFFTWFSTATIEQEQLVIDGDKAALLLHIHGTNNGGVMGLPPTDRPFSMLLVSLCDLKDGFITHERRVYDFTGLLLQVGALKAKPI